MVLLLIGVLALAFLNGGNDVSKGIATLVGSGVSQAKTAVIWGAFWTTLGAMLAGFVAQGLVQLFSGNGLIAHLPDGPAFMMSVTTGALLWIALATWSGLPVSTTHALIGGLIGTGIMVAGWSGVSWGALGQSFFLPLATSPLLSLLLVFIVFPFDGDLLGGLQKYCVCLHRESLAAAGSPVLALEQPPSVVVGRSAECQQAQTMVRLNTVDALHWLSAGSTSFTRGLNDAPKILALGLGANLALGISGHSGFALIAIAMGLGSLAAGFQVTETLAKKVTPMSPGHGFLANLITSLLVLLASTLALPVSTTHVSSGAIIGLGLRRDARSVHWNTVGEMSLAWLVTLPVAGIFAASIFAIARHFS